MMIFLLFVIAIGICRLCDILDPPKPRAEWKHGKWNGVQD
jgi:hypothetical protein